MKEAEKIEFLKNNHLPEWLKTRRITEDKLSSQQSAFCICGRLATGLHERNCRKFNLHVNRETAKELKHLIP